MTGRFGVIMGAGQRGAGGGLRRKEATLHSLRPPPPPTTQAPVLAVPCWCEWTVKVAQIGSSHTDREGATRPSEGGTGLRRGCIDTSCSTIWPARRDDVLFIIITDMRNIGI